MVLCWVILMICFCVSTFYTWKLEQDFKEWSQDIDVEFFKNYKGFKEE